VLLNDKAMLTSVLNYHVIKGKVRGKDIRARDSLSIQGQSLKIASNDGGYTVNGAKVSKHEINSVNGVIHPIDTVMKPKQ